MKVKDIKSKVAAKVARGKAKVAKKCGKGTKACAIVIAMTAAMVAISGCMGTTTPSRSQTLTLDHCTVNIYGSGDGTTNDVARVEIASQAMSVENSGTETQTATPTQTTDVKPDIDVDVSASKATGAQLGAVKDDCADGSCTDRE